MASTKWRLQGVTTWGGGDLVLSRLALSASGVDVPILSVSSSISPNSGSVTNLLVDDLTACTFAKETLQKPGFYIEVTVATPVEAWGFRAAGPSRPLFVAEYDLSDTVKAFRCGAAVFASGGLSAAPYKKPSGLGAVGVWEPQVAAGVRGWYGGGVSADGRVLLAVAVTNPPYLSTDGGATWTAQAAAGSRSWVDCSVSADGQVLLAVASNSQPPWLSKDGGATWAAQTPAGSRAWAGCRVSANGQTLFAVATDSSQPWLSKDAGNTWVAQTGAGTRSWRSCGASADGQVLLAGPAPAALQLSKDGGATWVAQTPAGAMTWVGCAVSSDGQVLLAVSNTSSSPWLSKDGGATWLAQTAAGARTWADCSVSADGQVLLAVANGALPQMSTDGGVTWAAVALAGTKVWYGVDISADGQVFLLTPDTDYPQRYERRDLAYTTPPLSTDVGQRVEIHGPTPPVFSARVPEVDLAIDREDGGFGTVYGAVAAKGLPSNAPLRRRVRLMHQASGRLIRETWSDRATGEYRFDNIRADQVYYTEAFDHERNFRGVMADNLTPEVLP